MPSVSSAAGFAGFPSEMPRFFRGLKRNNRREWFQPRKHLFEQHVKEPMLELLAAINVEMKKFAPEYVTEPKDALFRIYRDTRFSADKTPYKTHIAGSFSRRGGERLGTGGFYFSVSPENIEVAAGLWHPERDVMLAVRNHIADCHEELRRILADKKSRKLTGELQGDALSRSPKGFDPDHPAADFIKMKSWVLDVTLDPALATTPQLHRAIVERFRAMAPVVAYLNRPLLKRKSTRHLFDQGW
ncbi:MAG TPA: DUF2461 domain-containing protein [Bryobacteraceae bacterium]|nr:DUF2461 domain-containing protein [Bryobacteraceae bacterium]